MSNTAKWVLCAIFAVLGLIAFIYAVIYVATPIHALPGFVPGKVNVNGHYHKRALLCGVIAVVLWVIAGVFAVSARRSATQVGSTVGAGATVEGPSSSEDAG